MQRVEAGLENMPYRDLVELAKVNGVYQKKAAKKVTLIKRLSSLWGKEEMSMSENIDPNRSTFNLTLPPLNELDETVLSSDENEATNRRGTFTTKKRSATKRAMRSTTAETHDSSDNGFKALPEKELDISFKAPVETEETSRRATFTKKEKCENDVETEQSTTDSPARANSPVSKKLKLSQESEQTNRRETFTRSAKKPSNNIEPQAQCKSPHPPIRQNTFSKDESPSKIEGQTEPSLESIDATNHTPTRSKRLSKAELKSPHPPIRQNTFSKDESPSGKVEGEGQAEPSLESIDATNHTPTRSKRLSKVELKSPHPPIRQNTFTKDESPSGKVEGEGQAEPSLESIDATNHTPTRSKRLSKTNTPQASPKPPTRQNTFTKDESSGDDADGKMEETSTLDSTVNINTPKVVRPLQCFSSTKKKSSVKKIPNFAEIHKRNFAKMESLMENKMRWKERANQLMTPGRVTKVARKSLKKDKVDGKKSNIPILMMKMATKERLKMAVANKCLTGVTLIQKSKDKKFLGGVRMNKRFELQLNAVKGKALR